MSTLLSCQDLSVVGGQRYNCPYSVSTSADPNVDVSRETLVSLWDVRPRDNAACQQHEPPLRESHHSDRAPVTQQPWQDHLSPHLQRNRQLQDTLMQREEELARLHEENNKLKEFLNSSFVKCLEEKRKNLLNSSSRHRKRRQEVCAEKHGLCGRATYGVSKRTCRNLSLEFCSAEELAATPPLDSWVLQTLGLKDQDTIDPESGFGSPTLDVPQPSFNPAYTNPTTARYISPSTHYSPPAPTYTPTPTHTPTLGSTCDFSAIMDSSSSFSCSLQSSDSYAHGPDPTSPHSSSLSSALEYSSSSVEVPLVYPHTPTATGQPLLLSPALSERLAPVASSTPQRSPQVQCTSSPRPVEGAGDVCSPVRGRSELAFSMLLSPRSSVRTHSFSQGQAFVRKDVQGGWNFTWVPKQCA